MLGRLPWERSVLQRPRRSTTPRVPWMKAVEDSSRLSALSVPGSHDSLSLDGGSLGLARHQAWPLDLQLRAGIPAARLGELRHAHHEGGPGEGGAGPEEWRGERRPTRMRDQGQGGLAGQRR
ncbi:unnamed protein product [Arctogadus glacialis]